MGVVDTVDKGLHTGTKQSTEYRGKSIMLGIFSGVSGRETVSVPV